MSTKFPLLTLWALIAVMAAGYGQTTPSFLENVLAGRVPPSPEVSVPVYVEFGKPNAPNLETHEVKLKVSRSMASAEVNADRSPLRISEARPRFYVKLTGAPMRDRDILMLLDAANGKRVLLLSIGPGGLPQPMPGKQVELEYKTYVPSHYLIRPVAPLRAGEYCLTFGNSNRVFCFGIEPGATDSPADQEPLAERETKANDPNQERLGKLEALLAKNLITKVDYDARKEEILHPPPAKPITIEDRLRKLDDLLKKGLIGRPEYEKKRAELLSEI